MKKEPDQRISKKSLLKSPAMILFILLLTAAGSASMAGSDSFQQQIRITGTVTDASSGELMPGVNIMVKNTTTGTITDISGRYTISVSDAGASLIISFIGYVTREIPVAGQTIIDVAMDSETKGLDEVVVIGYGTQKKVNLSGAVDVVTSKSIESRPVSNLTQSLQGVSPSLNVTVGNSGGEMGARMNLNIRGLGSINGGAPYVLVDGMEQDINNLNPNDIENISVLKDAKIGRAHV